MGESALLKFAQPFLIGIGLLVVLNLWSILQTFLHARQSKDEKFEHAIEELTKSVVKLETKFEALIEDVNNLGKLLRERHYG